MQSVSGWLYHWSLELSISLNDFKTSSGFIIYNYIYILYTYLLHVKAQNLARNSADFSCLSLKPLKAGPEVPVTDQALAAEAGNHWGLDQQKRSDDRLQRIFII